MRRTPPRIKSGAHNHIPAHIRTWFPLRKPVTTQTSPTIHNREARRTQQFGQNSLPINQRMVLFVLHGSGIPVDASRYSDPHINGPIRAVNPQPWANQRRPACESTGCRVDSIGVEVTHRAEVAPMESDMVCLFTESSSRFLVEAGPEQTPAFE
jgi:hypothetical protein